MNFNRFVILIGLVILFIGCNTKQKQSSAEQQPAPKSLASTIPSTLLIPGGEIVSLTDNILGGGKGQWKPAYSDRIVQIGVDDKSSSDTVAVLSIISPVFLSHTTTKLALQAAAFRFIASDNSKLLIQTFPKLSMLRIVTYSEETSSTPPKRDAYGNVLQDGTQSTNQSKVGSFYVTREAIEKINVAFFQKSDESLRQAAQDFIEEGIGSRIADHWLTENDEFKKRFCERMYEVYCDPLRQIVKVGDILDRGSDPSSSSNTESFNPQAILQQSFGIFSATTRNPIGKTNWTLKVSRSEIALAQKSEIETHFMAGTPSFSRATPAGIFGHVKLMEDYYPYEADLRYNTREDTWIVGINGRVVTYKRR